MSLHRSFNDPDVVRLILDCAGAFIRDQVDRALEEKLPRYLGAAERRPPKASAPDAPPADENYVSRARAAEIMDCSERTITRYIDAGVLKACGPRRNRLTRFEIDRFMEQASERKAKGEGNRDESDVDAELDRILGDK